MRIGEIRVLTSKARNNLVEAEKYRQLAIELGEDVNVQDTVRAYRTFADSLERDAEELANIALKLSE